MITKIHPEIYLYHTPVLGDAREDSHGHLARALEAFFSLSGASREEVFRLSSGKPYFPSGNIHLSVTHTGSLFAAVFASFPIGIDGERLEEDREGVALRYFTEKERTMPFAKVWTAKEAVAKLDGRGLSLIRQITVEEDRAIFQGETYRLLSQRVGEYLLTVAVKESDHGTKTLSEK